MLFTFIYKKWFNEKLKRELDPDMQYENKNEFLQEMKRKLSFKALYDMHQRLDDIVQQQLINESSNKDIWLEINKLKNELVTKTN